MIPAQKSAYPERSRGTWSSEAETFTFAILDSARTGISTSFDVIGF